MGFLNNLIGNIKNKFSDDKGLFQKNKFVGFGGGNDFAKSQLDLGNSNIPLSSTQQPTYQQFKPQMETPVEQPSLNTTSSIDTLKNRIKSIQGLTPIKVKDPVPQIQPQPTPIIDRVKQIAQTGVNNLSAWGDVAKQGIKNQIDIQKNDFKDYVIDPLFNRPGENLGEGTFGGTVYRDLVKPVGRWAQTTGEELAGKTNRDLDELIANNQVKQKILDNKVDVYTQLVNSGQKNSPQAIRLREEIITGINQDSGFKKFQEDTLNKENQYKSDAIKTGMTVAGAGAAAANPMSLILPTAIGGAIGVAGGKDFGEAAGESFSNAVRWKSVTQFTDPAIGRTVNQLVSPNYAPVIKQITTRLISGTGNVVEDRIIDALEGKQRGIWDDVTSFGIGALMSNGGKGVTNWSQWKKDFSKNWTKDVSDSFKLDPNDSKLVEQTVGSMLDKVNKYMTSPEGMKMRQGFIRLPFGPDVEVKPEVDKFAGLDDETRGIAEAAEVDKTMGDADIPDNSIDLTNSIRDLENKINGTEAGQEAWRKLTNNNSYEEKGDYLKALIDLDKSLSKSTPELSPIKTGVDKYSFANTNYGIQDNMDGSFSIKEQRIGNSTKTLFEQKLPDDLSNEYKDLLKQRKQLQGSGKINEIMEVSKKLDDLTDRIIKKLGLEDLGTVIDKDGKIIRNNIEGEANKLAEELYKNGKLTPELTKQFQENPKQFLIDNSQSTTETSPIKTGDTIKLKETPKVNIANQPKDADTALKLFEEGKKRFSDEKYLRDKLEENGYDISKITIKGEPIQISSIFDKYKVPDKPIDLVISGQKVPVEQLKAEGWNENQINQAMKELDKDGTVPQDKIDSWIRKKLSDLNPKTAEKIKNSRKLPLPAEPSDSELVKMDRNAGEILETPIKTEPKPSKVTTQEKIVNPSGSGEVVKAKQISDLGSKSKPISEIKPKAETPKVETEKVETPKTKVDDKFAGEEARHKYENVDSSTIKNKKLASAVAQAKKLDQWEVNKNAVKSKLADNAWKKVAAIEKGTWVEEKITDDTIKRDTEEGTKELNRLIGRLNQSETQAFASAEKSGLVDIKSEDTDKIIDAIEKTDVKGQEYTPEDLENIKKTKEFWSRALAIGKKLGLKINETKNYFTHMYAEFQGSNMSGAKNLSQKTPFANSRKYKSYKQAFEEAGLTKAFNNIAEFGTRYMQKNLTTKAKIDFLASLPFKNVEDVKGLDYKPINKIKGVNIDENDRYLPSKLADMINGYFGDENSIKTLEKTAKIAKFFQDIKLNAGIPFTPANYYGIVQGFKEFQTELGQVVMGKKGLFKTHALKNFLRSFSKNASVEFDKKHIKDIIELKSTFKIDTEYNLKDMKVGFWDNIKDKKYGEAIERAMGNATFKRFMSQNMISTYAESKSTFMKNGMDAKTAKQTALALVEKLYGLPTIQSKYTGKNIDKLLGNKNVSNTLQTLIMAKDYKLQMSKMWINMAKAIKNPTAPENQGVVAYAIGIITTKLAMEAANMISTGKPMEQNPENLKDKAIIGLPGSKSGLTLQSVPGTGFIPKTLFRMGKSMVTGKGDVGKQAGSFASIPVGLVSDLANNEDYFGNNIWDSSDTTGEKAKKVAGYSSKEVISPYVTGAKSLKSILDKKKSGDVEDIKDSEINDILKAVEFPMSYVSKDRFETLHYYDKKKDAYNKLTKDEKVIFDKIEKKGIDFGSKQRDAVADAQDFVNYPAVLNAKKEIAIETAKANGAELDPLYKLTDEQLKTYYQIQGLRNNRDAQKALKAENEWIDEMQGERSKYFDGLIASGKMKAQESDYPKASPEVQKKIDYLTALKTPEIKKKQDYYYTLPKGTGARSAYIKANPDLLNYWNTKNAYNEANPDIQAFWDEVNAYNVKVDEAFGIKPEEDTTSSGSSGYSGWQNWGEKEPNVYTYLNKITGKRKSTLKNDINSIIKTSKASNRKKELATLFAKNYKNLNEIFSLKKHK